MRRNGNIVPAEWNAGCSALSWSTQDGKHLWGRNFDFNRMAQGTKVSYVPAGTEYYTCGATTERNVDKSTRCRASYAALGTGFLMIPSIPVLYEGINDQGLMGGQLYYREFAHYEKHVNPGTQKIQPPYVVYHVLAQCATVTEAVELLRNRVTIMNLPLLGSIPPLHWSFSDRTGEMIVVEPDKEGLKIYRNTLGVMTNSPSYSWHRLNLLNYGGIRNLDYDVLKVNEECLRPCFSGSGAQGLPGDWSSPSRFIRLAFLRNYCVKGEDERQGVTNMWHLFQSASFPLGMVRITEQGAVTKYDKEISPYDYTIYTSIMCGESLRFYWTTYQNQQMQCVDMNHLKKGMKAVQFDLEQPLTFHMLTEIRSKA